MPWSQGAKQALTAVSAQDRARTLPRLPKTRTLTWGLLKWGKGVCIVVAHSVTRGWQDSVVFLQVGEVNLKTISTMPD